MTGPTIEKPMTPTGASTSSASGTGLVIRVSGGTGEGQTPLSAFDHALYSAGVANFNLIRLSSVIPPGSVVRSVAPADQLAGGFGDALYCVYATGWASEPGTEVWAGVGWSRGSDGAGHGLFVEHTGATEADVRHQLKSTLADMGARRGGGFRYGGEVLASARCQGLPACAVVVATYRSVDWRSR